MEEEKTELGFCDRRKRDRERDREREKEERVMIVDGLRRGARERRGDLKVLRCVVRSVMAMEYGPHRDAYQTFLSFLFLSLSLSFMLWRRKLPICPTASFL